MKEKAPCMHGVDFLRTFAWQILAASAVSALPALHSGSCWSAVRIPEACPAPDLYMLLCVPFDFSMATPVPSLCAGYGCSRPGPGARLGLRVLSQAGLWPTATLLDGYL